MTFATLTQSRSFAVPRRSALSIRFSPSLINIVLLGTAAVLGVWYLAQVNATLDKGYKIRETQKQVRELEAQARSGEIKLTEMETVSNLTAQAAALGMVPVGTVEYVSKTTPGVAIR
jgi:hypothetical protein